MSQNPYCPFDVQLLNYTGISRHTHRDTQTYPDIIHTNTCRDIHMGMHTEIHRGIHTYVTTSKYIRDTCFPGLGLALFSKSVRELLILKRIPRVLKSPPGLQDPFLFTRWYSPLMSDIRTQENLPNPSPFRVLPAQRTEASRKASAQSVHAAQDEVAPRTVHTEN